MIAGSCARVILAYMPLQMVTKLLPIPFYPVGLSVILIASSLMALRLRKRTITTVLLSTALVVLWTTSTHIVAHGLYQSLEKRHTPLKALPAVAAIVLLGDATVAPVAPREYPELNTYGDRLLHAARLFKKNTAPYLIPTGGKLPHAGLDEFTDAEVSRDLLVELFDIDSGKILVEPTAFNTHDHPKAVAEILREKDLPFEIILVTSAVHMHRSVLVFEKYGFTVHSAPTDFRADEKPLMRLRAFLPDAHALAKTTAALHEYYGLIAYKVLGWI